MPLYVLDYFKNSFVKKNWGQHPDVRVEEENISIFVDKLTAILFWVYFKEIKKNPKMWMLKKLVLVALINKTIFLDAYVKTQSHQFLAL